MLLLVQFVLRLASGLATATLLVPPRFVTAGYYRANLQVLLGMQVVVLLAVLGTSGPLESLPLWLPIAGLLAAYGGAAAWHYGLAGPGWLLTATVAVASLVAAWLVPVGGESPSGSLEVVWAAVDPLVAGLLLGIAVAAMLLGHWYLNAPGMQLVPLKRLIAALAIAVLLRLLVSGGAWLQRGPQLGSIDMFALTLLGLHWLGGIVGTALLAFLAYETLRIPNTQSATGILYVAVITTFVGELAALLLAAPGTVGVS